VAQKSTVKRDGDDGDESIPPLSADTATQDQDQGTEKVTEGEAKKSATLVFGSSGKMTPRGVLKSDRNAGGGGRAPSSPRMLTFGGATAPISEATSISSDSNNMGTQDSTQLDDLLPPPLQLKSRLSSRFSVMPSTYEELAQDVQPKDSKVLAAHFAYIQILNNALEKDLIMIDMSKMNKDYGISSKPFARRVPTRTLSASLQEGKGLLFNYSKSSLIEKAISSTSSGSNRQFTLTLSRPKCMKVSY
jgi:hypothetical protein